MIKQSEYEVQFHMTRELIKQHMLMDERIKKAEQLATEFHKDQTDKNGLPYIDHLRRVATHTKMVMNRFIRYDIPIQSVLDIDNDETCYQCTIDESDISKMDERFVLVTAAVCAAWLHDSIEDTSAENVPHLLNRIQDTFETKFSFMIIDMIGNLTRKSDSQTYKEYIDEVKYSHAITRVIKLCDLCDNTDPARLASLDDTTIERLLKKYNYALEKLMH